MAHGVKHTREEIIEGIKRVWSEGGDLRTSAVQKIKHQRWMFRSCGYYFDDWKDALSAAGISYDEVKERVRERQRQAFLEELAQAHREGVDLSAVAMQEGDSSLYNRSKRFYRGGFGWENALTDADLPVDEIVRQRRWDKEKVKGQLVARGEKGKPTHLTAVRDDQYDLYRAAINHFDSYDEALRYAGFNPGKVRKTGKPLSSRQVLMKITQLHAMGKSLYRKNIIDGDDKELRRYVYAAEGHFGGWPAAVKKAGIDYSKHTTRKEPGFWTKGKVLEVMKRLWGEGKPLNVSGVSNSLRKAVIRNFGSWDKALLACEIDPAEARLRPVSLSKGEIVREIKSLRRKGHELNFTGMMYEGGEKTERIYNQACNRFGSWKEAIKAAGLSYDKIGRGGRKYTVKELGKKLSWFKRQGLSIRAIPMRDNPRTRFFYKAVMSSFDSWADFLEEVGVERKGQLNALEFLLLDPSEMRFRGKEFANFLK
jgi:hypothetical protein